MRCVRFILYVLAALAYAGMPINGMASQPMEHQHSVMANMVSVLAVAQDHSDCAGKPPSGKHTGSACGHCAACLTLPAKMMIADVQALMRTAPMPGLGASLLSQINMPLVPPPRR